MPNELHTMPLKLERLFSSLKFRSMRWDEKGAYLLLLCEGWLKGGLIEAQAELIKGILNGIDNEDMDRIQRNVIDRCFQKNEDGDYYNDSQVAIYNEVKSRVEKMSEAGRKGGLRQAQGRLKGGLSNQIQIQNQSQTGILDSSLHSEFQDNQKEKNICSEPGSPSPEPTTAIPPKRKRSEHLEKFKFDWDKLDWDWEAIPQEWADAMKVAYPAVNICLEMERAKAWLIANPTKAKLNNCRFLTNWFRTTQEKGGTKG